MRTSLSTTAFLVLLLLTGGCGEHDASDGHSKDEPRQAPPTTASEPKGQRVEPMNEEDRAFVDAKRAWVRGHYTENAEAQYATVEGKLRLLDTILKSDWVKPGETAKLQSLGITFGDALAQEAGLTWVSVEDEYGRDPALRLEDTSILLFPMTTISKRIERGEVVDVRALFSSALKVIRERARAKKESK